MIHLYFLKILRKFCDFWKFYLNFRKNLGSNLEPFLNMELAGVRGAEPPDASENIKKLFQKSMETSKISKIFMNL